MTQHVFIAGMSYCGSTLFSLSMGSLPGCVAVDESNWLVPHPGEALPGFKFSDANYRSVCRHCEDECRHFSRSFRENLQSDPSCWAGKLSKQFDGQVVVTAEKESHYLDSIYSDSAYDMVVLFKHPLSQWRSFEKRRWRNDSQRSVVARWCSEYASHIERNIDGRKIFVEFDRFLARPDGVMKKVAKSLKLDYCPGFAKYWEFEHHYVGGNFALNEKLKNSPRSLPFQKPARAGYREWKKGREFSRQFPDAIQLYKKLRKLHV